MIEIEPNILLISTRRHGFEELFTDILTIFRSFVLENTV